jgi:hypothetical protein
MDNGPPVLLLRYLPGGCRSLLPCSSSPSFSETGEPHLTERNPVKPILIRRWRWFIVLAVALLGLWCALDYIDRHAAAGQPGRYTVF